MTQPRAGSEGSISVGGPYPRSRGAPAARSGDHSRPDEEFNPELTRWLFAVLERTVCRYFRVQVLGTDQLPPGRGLVVGCHSGVLPWDATCLVVALHRATGRFSRNVGDRFFEGLGAVGRLLRATGVVIGERGAVERLLEQGHLVVVFPGGADDMRRPIWRRYRLSPSRGLRPGRGGYVKAAIRTASPVIPVAIVGAEEIHLMLGDVPFFARLLGVPFVPIVASAWPLPARIYIRFGEPVRFAVPPEAADDQDLVDRLNREVQDRLQTLIDDTVRRRRGVYWSRWDGDDP